MEIIISIDGKDCQEDLLSFYEWLMDDRDIRGSADIELVEAQPQAGSMAGEIELISLLVSSGFNIASLAVAIAGWRACRTAPPPAQIQANGIHLTVNDIESETVEKISKAFSTALGDDKG